MRVWAMWRRECCLVLGYECLTTEETGCRNGRIAVRGVANQLDGRCFSFYHRSLFCHLPHATLETVAMYTLPVPHPQPARRWIAASFPLPLSLPSSQ